MLGNPIKLKFHRREYLSQSRAKDNKTNIEKIKKSSAIHKEKFLIDKNVSIMIDEHFESDVVDNVCLQHKQHVDAKTSNTSNTSSQDSYVMIAEEMPIVLNDTNWVYVDYHDITESIQSNSTVKKYCSPKCSSAWFLKIRRAILKNFRNKIYPVLTDCTNG